MRLPGAPHLDDKGVIFDVALEQVSACVRCRVPAVAGNVEWRAQIQPDCSSVRVYQCIAAGVPPMRMLVCRTCT